MNTGEIVASYYFVDDITHFEIIDGVQSTWVTRAEFYRVMEITPPKPMNWRRVKRDLRKIGLVRKGARRP